MISTLLRLPTFSPLFESFRSHRGVFTEAATLLSLVQQENSSQETAKSGKQQASSSSLSRLSAEHIPHLKPKQHAGALGFQSIADVSAHAAQPLHRERQKPFQQQHRRLPGWGLAQQRLQEQQEQDQAAGGKGRPSSRKTGPSAFRGKQRGRKGGPGWVPTHSDGDGFGAVSPRPPGGDIKDLPERFKQWTLQAILEAHHANLEQVRAKHKLGWDASAVARGPQLSAATEPASCGQLVELQQATSNPSHTSVGVQSLDSGKAFARDDRSSSSEKAGLGRRPVRMPTKQRLQMDMETGLEVFHNNRPSDHRWVTHRQEQGAAMADMQEVDWEEKDSNPLHEEEDEEQLDSSKPEASAGRPAYSTAAAAATGGRENPELAEAMTIAPSFTEMENVFERAVRSGKQIHSRCIYLLCSRARSVHRLQDIWRCIERGRQLGVAPTESWFKVVARACAEVHSFYALREVLPALLEAGLPLSKAMLEAIIKACGFVKRFEYAWDMVHLMEAAGFQPDLVTVNCLLNMYADGRQPDLTEELFGKLSGLGITPNHVSWCILAKAWGRVGNLGQMEAVLAEATRAGYQPLLPALASAMAAYASKGDYTAARKVIEDLRAPGTAKLLATNAHYLKFLRGMYCSLMQAYSRAGEVAAAESALKEAVELGLRPTMAYYSCIMWAYKEMGDVEACRRLFKECESHMKCGRVQHTFLVEAAMQAWSMRGRPEQLLDEAVQLFVEARRLGFWGDQRMFKQTAPEGSQLDLHTLGPWTAQLMILSFMQDTAARMAGGWAFPHCDMTLVTGRGSNSKNNLEQPVIRDVTLRFLQSMFSPHLSAKNDGLVVVRRWELIHFLGAVNKAGQRIDAHTFQDCFIAWPPFQFLRAKQ